MAVVLQSATRVRPAPCQHFVAVLNADGVRQVSVDISADEMLEPITEEDLRGVLKAWARYQRSKGKTPAQMVGAIIFPDIA